MGHVQKQTVNVFRRVVDEITIIFLVYFTRSTDNGVKYSHNRLALSSFEPTLQSRSMTYIIHGFTAGVFTPPSGEQGRLRRTNNPEEHTLAGSQISLFGFRHFMQSFKGPSKSSSP